MLLLMADQKESSQKVDFVQKTRVFYTHSEEVSKEPDSACITPSQRPGSEPRRLPFQLQHETLTAEHLRAIVHRRVRRQESQPERTLWRELNSACIAWWAGHMPGDTCEFIETWLNGGDFLFIGQELGWKRSSIYDNIGRFLRACSFWYLRRDLETECDQTHRSAGGDGNVPLVDKRLEYKASSCPTCTILKGASWEGWVTPC